LVINPIFDSTVTSLSNASTVEAAFTAAALFYGNSFSDPATVNIQVSWGQVQGFSLPSFALGASTRVYVGPNCQNCAFPYGFIRTLLLSDASGSIDTTALSFLPDPASVTSADPNYQAYTAPYFVPVAEARAIGLYPANDIQIDGYIGFGGSSTSQYSYNAFGSITPGTYDFDAVAKHEIAEVLGRVSGIGLGFYMPLDLFRYSSPGLLDYTASGPAYLSSNGGMNAERGFNNRSPGDVSDWSSPSSPPDVSDAFTAAGVAPSFGFQDQDALDLIGWNVRGCGGVIPSTCSVSNGSVSASDVPEDLFVFTLGQAGILVAYSDLAVPEPASLLLLGVGLGAAVALARWRASSPGNRSV
jgi:hypothetical protein